MVLRVENKKNYQVNEVQRAYYNIESCMATYITYIFHARIE